MLQVTKIDPTALATVLGILGFFVGLIAGFIAMVMSVSANSVIYTLPLFGAEDLSVIMRSVLSSLGPLSIVVFAFLFSLEGLVFGFVIAVMYNLIVPKFGGIAFSVAEQVVTVKPTLREVSSERQLTRPQGEEEVPEQLPEEVAQDIGAQDGMQEMPSETSDPPIPRARRRAIA